MSNKPQYTPPTPDEVRSLLKKWELKGAGAGALIDTNGRSIRRYTGGESKMSYPVLFTLVAKNEGTFITVENWREELSQ